MRIYSSLNASPHCLTPGCGKPVSAKNLCRGCYSTAYSRMRRKEKAALPMPDFSLPGEEWRPIAKLDGRYQISNLGRLRRAVGGKGTRAGKILVAPFNRNGYRMAVIHYGGSIVSLKIHSAVAEAFIGPRPRGMQVNHIDGNKANNSAANVEYVTRPQNMQHAVATGLKKAKGGESNGQHVLTEDAVREIRAPGSGSLAELGRRFGVTKQAIHHVRKGRTWAHVK